MINVQQRLVDSFALLPKVGGYPANGPTPAFEGFQPHYDWGDELHLNKLIKLFNNKKETPYPLIYNIANQSTQDSNYRNAPVNVSLILATRNTHVDYTNSKRWASSYENILFPLANYIEQLFSKGLMFLWNGEFTLLEFPNYGEEGENKTTDIWDALRFDTQIKINGNCTNKYIKFKTL